MILHLQRLAQNSGTHLTSEDECGLNSLLTAVCITFTSNDDRFSLYYERLLSRSVPAIGRILKWCQATKINII